VGFIKKSNTEQQDAELTQKAGDFISIYPHLEKLTFIKVSVGFLGN
jgi:Zn/Cd-binding protein ZinT